MKSLDYELSEIMIVLYLLNGVMIGNARSTSHQVDLYADLNKGSYYLKIILTEELDEDIRYYIVSTYTLGKTKLAISSQPAFS